MPHRSSRDCRATSASARTGGTVLGGLIHVRYADGTGETVSAGDVYYWPPGHTVRVDEDYEALEFSPSAAMFQGIDPLNSKLTR
jgi:hypothetical protein